jgi:hypothetical protein
MLERKLASIAMGTLNTTHHMPSNHTYIPKWLLLDILNIDHLGACPVAFAPLAFARY